MALSPTINEIREITSVLTQKLKMDYSNYAFSFLRRRFAYLFNELKIKNTNFFIENITNKELIEDFCYTFPVIESEMFRDPSFWRVLKNKVLSSIENEVITFWFPELTSAEELYSLLIILKEENLLAKSKIYCNIDSIKRKNELLKLKIDSKKKDIIKSNFKRLELSSTFENYFKEEDGFLHVDKEYINSVVFLKGNYFNSIPEHQVNIALFRNRMLYYNNKLKVEAEKQLYNGIVKNGYLAIGIKENISVENSNAFYLYDKGEQVYQVV